MLAISGFFGALGPYVTGALSDAYASSLGAESMRYALLSVVVPGWLWCALHFWMSSRALARELVAKHDR